MLSLKIGLIFNDLDVFKKQYYLRITSNGVSNPRKAFCAPNRMSACKTMQT